MERWCRNWEGKDAGGRPGDECKEGWRGPEARAIHDSVAKECARRTRAKGSILALLLGRLYHCFEALRCMIREESCNHTLLSTSVAWHTTGAAADATQVGTLPATTPGLDDIACKLRNLS